jgi:hypothetical protein
MRHNYTFLILLVISAVIFTIFIGPALKMHNMGWLSYVFYGLVVIIFFYGRQGGARNRPRPGSRS